MKGLKVNKEGIILELGQNQHLYLKSVKILPITTSSREKVTFVNLVQQLSQKCDLLTFEMKHECVNVYVGKFVIKPDTSKSDLDYFEELKNFIKLAFPSNLQIEEYTGYKNPIAELTEDQISLASNKNKWKQTRFYDFSELSVLDYHTKIFKLILEIPNAKILISKIKFESIKYYIGVQITSQNIELLEEHEKLLISNLQKTPYLTGKINSIGKKYLNDNPGKAVLGITKNTVSKLQYNSFIEMIPKILPDFKILPVPVTFPLSLFNKSDKNPKKEVEINSELLFTYDIRPNSQFQNKLNEFHWEVLSYDIINENQSEIIIENEYVKLKVSIEISTGIITMIQQVDDLVNLN